MVKGTSLVKLVGVYNNKKAFRNGRLFCGAYETRTRDLLRDRQAF